MNSSSTLVPGQWAKHIKPQNSGIANFLAFALLPLSGFATDIYLPSLPGMATDLQVGPVQVQFTITIFLISYGLSQLFIGSILDSYGRYNSSLASLAVFTLASITAAMTHSIEMIYAMRVIQGVTVGFVVAGKRAFFVDLYTGDKLKNYLGMFSIIWSTGPIIAPFVGGYLQTLYGWRANFWFLAVLGGLLCIAEYLFSGETLPQRSPFKLKRVMNVYREMITHLPFVLGIALMGLSYAMVMVANMTAPFIIEHHLQFDAVTTGYCSLILGLAWMVGGFISKAVIHIPFFRKLGVNITLQALLVLIMIPTVRYFDNIYALVLFAFAVHVGAGFTFNNYMTFSMTRFPKNAGVASGLTGGFVFLCVSGLSYGIINVFPASDGMHLALSYGILSALVIVVIILAKRSTPVVH
ncbi:MFS transporter [Paraflavitalea pollutisoli]|uniref:MFS transporter n=1 Tax=Paraflavitalea pollutisoli TaxID=3034143 RepID=UPI0023EAD227|nr:MFS transporter [Paraflavitalea sp. H1-2-19X]